MCFLQVSIRWQFAESLERDERFTARTFQDQLGRRANKVDITFLDLLTLRTRTDLSLTLGADDDRGAFDCSKCRLATGSIEVGLDDAELFNRRVVEDRGGVGAVCGGVEFDESVVGGCHLLLLDGRVGVGEG